MRKSNVILATISMFLVVVIASFILNTPFVVAYLKSGSMEPTLNKFDIILINPLDRNFNEGDIIVFKSGNEWICHRIVGTTSGGYITKGDNNIVSDQFSGKGVASPDAIAGKVLVLGGKPIAIPEIGKEVQKMEGYFNKNKIYTLILLITAGFFLLAGSDRSRRRKKFIRFKSRNIFALTSVILILLITFVSVGVFENKSIDYGTTVALGKRANWVAPGEDFVRFLELKNDGLYPYYYVVSSESSRIELAEDSFLLYPKEEKMLQVFIHAPEDTSLYSEKFKVMKYLPVFPPNFTKFLSEKHQYLPILAMDVLLAFVLSIAYLTSGGEDEIRIKIGWRSLKRKLLTEVF